MVTLHLVLFAISASALGAAGLRWAGGLSTALATRVLGAVALAAAFAFTESMVLGLASQGTNPWTLTAAALVTWVAARLTLAAPQQSVRQQVATRWSEYSSAGRAAFGAVTAAILGIAVFQLWRPAIGDDGLTYHAAQPAVWIATGQPGSLRETLADFPTQAYPKTMEVLVGWTYSVGRTPLAAVPLTIGLSVLAAAAVFAALRRLGVSPAVAAATLAAGLLLPLNVRETSGIFSDLPALAWMACSVALSVMSAEEPGAVGLAAVAGGLAIGTKPTSAPFVLVGLGYAIWINRAWVIAHWRSLVVPAGLAVGLASLWYVVDWVHFGSPLWPFTRFPSGRPIPLLWTQYGARFIDHPIAAVREAGAHPYVHYLAGGLVVLAAVPLVMLLSLLPSGRPVRRTAIWGFVAVLVEVVLWADSEFTGLAHGDILVVVTGLRYLIPAPLAAASVLAVLTRERSIVRVPAVLAILGAVVLNLVQLHGAGIGFPFRPSLLACLGLLVVGAVAATVFGRVGVFGRLAGSRWAMPVVAIVVALVATLPASRYVQHYLLVSHRYGFDDAPILSYLSRQPGWVHGTAPVAAGYAAYATLAGPHFQHPLSYIPNDEPCAAVRSAAQHGWVVIQPIRNEPYASLDYLRAPACLRGIAPVAVVGSGTRIYAPSDFVVDPPA